MNSDCALRTGKTHSLCQDYCVAGSVSDMHYVILADGCSGSPDTDIGARLLVKSSEALLKQGNNSIDTLDFYREATTHAFDCVQRLGLDSKCLDATLLMISATEKSFTATCYGDGVIAIGATCGCTQIYSVGFSSGYPDYPSYLLDDDRHAQITERNAKDGKTITSWTLPESDGGAVLNTPDAIVTWPGNWSDTRFVAVASDGLHSFQRMTETPTSRSTHAISVPEVSEKLFGFKNTKGQFVQRRMQGFLKECAVNYWQHHDDLSIGAVVFGE